MVTDVPHSNVIPSSVIDDFIEYIDGLIADSEDESYSLAERVSFKEELDEYDADKIESLREMHEHTAHYGGDFISEDYWEEHAANEADELHLYNVPEFVRHYFDYDSYADDLRHEYSEYDYDGVTYYVQD